MAGTFLTSNLGRLGWALIGALVAYILFPNRVISYPEVIVPAARIIIREVPSGPPSLVERIKYVYLQPEVRAVAPGGALDDVARFCRPLLMASTDTVKIGTPSVIRSVSYNPSLLPLTKGSLLVTSMDGYGDLVAEDFRLRVPFGVAAGLQEPYSTTVRYPRWAPLRELGSGALWYLTFRSIEAILKQ